MSHLFNKCLSLDSTVTTSFLHVNLNETAANTAQDGCGELVLWICETEVLGMSTARAQSSPECWRSKESLSASPTGFHHEGIMAQHYPWSLSGVKVQAVRIFGISESLCKQVRINIFASEALGKKNTLLQSAWPCWNRELSSPGPGRIRVS